MSEMQRWVKVNNFETLMRLGVYPKEQINAQRVIIDLKDKVGLISENDQFIGNISNTNQDEALSALEVLGYNRKQTSKVIEMLINNSPEITVEELIKGALNKL